MTGGSGLTNTMKILACIYLNANGNACMPTPTPLAIRTVGKALAQGKYLISGEIVCTAGALTLAVHSASPSPDMQEFMFCAAIADHDGIIENTALVCGFDGPFAGKLTDIVEGEAFFESNSTSHIAEAALPASLAVATTDKATNEDAAALPSKASGSPVVARSDTQAGRRRIVITSPPLGIPFPDDSDPCPGLCPPPKPTPKQPTSAAGETAKLRGKLNHISREEVMTF